jgi:hypothetical protein
MEWRSSAILFLLRLQQHIFINMETGCGLPSKHSLGIQYWICDYCNDASFSSFLEASKHEMSCSRNSHPAAFSLSIPEDGHNLSDRQCFLRSHCIEAFVVNASHWSLLKGSSKPSMGQVGLRCKFCCEKPSYQRADRSMCFPSSLSR